MNTTGMYRLSGSKSICDTFLASLFGPARFEASDYTPTTLHSIAVVLKRVIRNLQEPLMTWDFKERVAYSELDADSRLPWLHQRVLQLPEMNQRLLSAIALHLAR